MVRENQITVDHEDDLFICTLCDNRRFPSETSLFQHCRSNKLHRAEWCERCRWLFVSDQARTAHVRSSDMHGFCSFCSKDLADKDELASHQARVHQYCSQCQLICQDYTEHRIEDHNQCPECGEEFKNNNNLTMVSDRHILDVDQALIVFIASPSASASIKPVLRMSQEISS